MSHDDLPAKLAKPITSSPFQSWKGNYVSFLIRTEPAAFKVRRRFRDFTWLYNVLRGKFIFGWSLVNVTDSQPTSLSVGGSRARQVVVPLIGRNDRAVKLFKCSNVCHAYLEHVRTNLSALCRHADPTSPGQEEHHGFLQERRQGHICSDASACAQHVLRSTYPVLLERTSNLHLLSP